VERGRWQQQERRRAGEDTCGQGTGGDGEGPVRKEGVPARWTWDGTGRATRCGSVRGKPWWRAGRAWQRKAVSAGRAWWREGEAGARCGDVAEAATRV
jgi:hypothetical protein